MGSYQPTVIKHSLGVSVPLYSVGGTIWVKSFETQSKIVKNVLSSKCLLNSGMIPICDLAVNQIKCKRLHVKVLLRT